MIGTKTTNARAEEKIRIFINRYCNELSQYIVAYFSPFFASKQLIQIRSLISSEAPIPKNRRHARRNFHVTFVFTFCAATRPFGALRSCHIRWLAFVFLCRLPGWGQQVWWLSVTQPPLDGLPPEAGKQAFWRDVCVCVGRGRAKR